MLSSDGPFVLIERSNRGLTSRHYSSAEDVIYQLLTSRGPEFAQRIIKEVIPEVQQAWEEEAVEQAEIESVEKGSEPKPDQTDAAIVRAISWMVVLGLDALDNCQYKEWEIEEEHQWPTEYAKSAIAAGRLLQSFAGEKMNLIETWEKYIQRHLDYTKKVKPAKPAEVSTSEPLENDLFLIEGVDIKPKGDHNFWVELGSTSLQICLYPSAIKISAYAKDFEDCDQIKEMWIYETEVDALLSSLIEPEE